MVNQDNPAVRLQVLRTSFEYKQQLVEVSMVSECKYWLSA